MKELKIGDETTKDIFIQAFRDNNIVPILGAGFSTGRNARNDCVVPSGNGLKNYMINQILDKKDDILKSELDKESFSFVAELFERTFSDPQVSKVKDYFYNHFTGVKIDKLNQLHFINDIDWEYVYTLNIDTAIENSKPNGWEVYYPNSDFDERKVFEERKKLFKIHGDIFRFCKTFDYNEMILTQSQYINSLEKNSKFHNMLSADCENKNLIYIGCSLDDEIDIQYSVLSDKNRNFVEKATYRIYVTAEKLTSLKKEKLISYNISHYIQLENTNDYDMLYEFLVNCYYESLKDKESNIEQYKFNTLQIMNNDIQNNLNYLANLNSKNDNLPYYFIVPEKLNEINLSTDKVNIIIGRRFVGKTLLAYNIMQYRPNYKRYFIASDETIGSEAINELLNMENGLIIFDSDSLDDYSFIEVLNGYQSSKNNVVCIFLNSYDEIVNLIGYHLPYIHRPLENNMDGKFSQIDIKNINEKLHNIGISMFNQQQNLLDNTLRIANIYNKNIGDKYDISEVDELIMIIWILAKNKMYYEEIVTLGLAKKYKQIVERYSPFLQEEKCKKSEIRRHSLIKVICNSKLGLLQVLNSYVYPPKSEMADAIVKMRHTKICESIYEIMYRFNRVDQEQVKKFIMFDTLNDIFSRKYSFTSIEYLMSEGESGKNLRGAVGIIHEIYKNEKIKNLKSDDPNYWLQKAKSIYITNYKHFGSQKELEEGIIWAKKAEQDSIIKSNNGAKKYLRTVSNATMQIATIYGKLASLRKYSDREVNDNAIDYYYKGFSDTNNMEAAKTLLINSKGTKDFINLMDYITTKSHCVSDEYRKQCDYLLNIRINGDIAYSL